MPKKRVLKCAGSENDLQEQQVRLQSISQKVPVGVQRMPAFLNGQVPVMQGAPWGSPESAPVKL